VPPYGKERILSWLGLHTVLTPGTGKLIMLNR
jgi:hypothetical protein